MANVTFAVPAALWALAAIPALVVLYLLRVRRREHVVSSVLLWRRSAPSASAFRPSRRIERSLLLLLQIVAAAALAGALAQPSVVGRAAGSGDVVLVLDGSMSMRARDVAPTRFDRARAEAGAVLARLGPGRRAAVVLAADRPLVLTPPSANPGAARAALGRAAPWDVAGDVAGAVALAAQLAPRGRIEVWTDGAHSSVPDLPDVTVHRVGTAQDHVGIVALRVAHSASGPAQGFIRLANFGRTAVRAPLTVTRDGAPVYAATVALPPGETHTAVFPVPGPGLVRAQLHVTDALPDDDTAAAELDAAALPSVLLVGPDDPPLERLLRFAPVARAAVTGDTDPAAWNGYDVVILDRVRVGAVPPGRYLMFGTVPSNLPVEADGTVEAPQVATWDRLDPLMRFVDLGDVHIRQALRLSPQAGRVLAAGASPLVWAYDGVGLRAVVVAFGLDDSDLAQHVAFPVLVANSLAWLGGDTGDLRAGQTLDVPAAGAVRGVLERPDGSRTGVRARDNTFSIALPRAGVYRLTTPAGERTFTVALGSDDAARIAPREAAVRAPETANAPHPTRVAIWPWCLLLGAAVLAGEWALATRRHGGDA